MSAATVWDLLAERFSPQRPHWASPSALACEIDPERVRTPALDLIDQALVDVAEGRCKRLMINIPPQEGKSTLVTHAFPRWLLTHKPDTRVVIASYEKELATRSGRAIREDIASLNGEDGGVDLGLRVRQADRRADRWSIEGHAGGVFCAGMTSALTGRSADVVIIDDPLRDMEQAQSSTYRERAWRWWQSTARTRFGPDTAVIVVCTRWHAEDLAGKMLAADPTGWRVLAIPAICDEPESDPLGRDAGEPMVSARGRTLMEWQAIQNDVGEYVWNALYQQRPAALAGGLYKRDRFRYWSPSVDQNGRTFLDLEGQMFALEDTQRFLVADLAASVKTSADFTVIAAFAITLAGDIVLLDLHRERMTPDKHLDAARPMFRRWGAHTLYVEQMFHSATLVYDAARAGIPVSPLQPDTDKITRALSATARVQQGKVFLPTSAAWVPAFLDELAAFPNGSKDDQADVLAYAARFSVTHWIAPETSEETARRLELDESHPDREFERLLDSAFPSTVGGIDWSTVSI